MKIVVDQRAEMTAIDLLLPNQRELKFRSYFTECVIKMRIP